jgi:hypothetical protein
LLHKVHCEAAGVVLPVGASGHVPGDSVSVEHRNAWALLAGFVAA